MKIMSHDIPLPLGVYTSLIIILLERPLAWGPNIDPVNSDPR